VPPRDLVQLAVNQWKQLGKGMTIPCLELVQEAGHGLLGRLTHVGGLSHGDTGQM